MLRSDWDHDGIVHSAMEIHKEPDGRYKAHFPAHPIVPPAIGRDECEAVNLAKQALQKAHEQGKVGS